MSNNRIKASGTFGDEFVIVDEDGRILARGRPATLDRYGAWMFGNNSFGSDEFYDRSAALAYAKKVWCVRDEL